MIFAPGTYPYVQRFYAYGLERGRLTEPIVNLAVVFVPQTYPGIAQCIRGEGSPIIQLDPKYWATFDDMDREQLMFHELGHCVLNREHDPRFITFGIDTIPESIMYPVHFAESTYVNYHDYYIIELFSE